MRRYIILLIYICFAIPSLTQTKIENQLIVKFSKKPNLNLFSERSVHKVNQINLLSDDLHIYLIQGNQPFIAEDMERIKKDDQSVLSVSYNYEVESRSVPNDPFYKDQWAIEFCKIEKVWEITTGGKTKSNKDIVIGVLDNGIDILHQDLKDNIYVNKLEIPNDNKDNDNNGYVDDVNGYNVDTRNGAPVASSHGTGVSGILGAKSDNSIGISGVNWNVKILPVHGVNRLDEIISSNQYFLKMRKEYNTSDGQRGANIVVVNYSGGIPNAFGNLEPYKSWCDMYELLGTEGILSVGSTANSNVDVSIVGDMPSTCVSDYLINTTNVGRNGAKAIEAGFSKKFIDMAAPGEGLFTLEANNAYTKNFSGTSGSAPLIAGTIALLYSLPCKGLDDLANRDRVLTSQIIKDAIKQSVIQTPSLKLNTKWGGYLNANGAMQRLTKYCSGEDVIPSPTGPLSILSTTYEGFQISLEYLTPDNQSSYEVMVNDVSGKKIVYEKLEIPEFGAKLVNFNAGFLASGIYFVSVISPTGIATRKLLVP